MNLAEVDDHLDFVKSSSSAKYECLGVRVIKRFFNLSPMRVPPQLNLGWIVLLASRLPGVGGLKSGRLDPLTRRDIVYIRSHVPFAQNSPEPTTMESFVSTVGFWRCL